MKAKYVCQLLSVDSFITMASSLFPYPWAQRTEGVEARQ
jgi:hypothetical protein